MLSPRQEKILKMVVEGYVREAEPIGSKYLSETGKLDVSGATIRNELRILEDLGFLTHPHTSSGRVPTENGYKYYVNSLNRNLPAPTNEIEKKFEELKQLMQVAASVEQRMKLVARQLSQMTRNAVIVSDSNGTYSTGMSKLLEQPEFSDNTRALEVSSILDDVEEYVDGLRNSSGTEIKVMIGNENPFGANCSVITLEKDNTLYAVLGPMRMKYRELRAILELINKLDM